MLNEGSENPLPEDKLRIMMDQFVDQGLMFSEDDCYLSLAVRKIAVAISPSRAPQTSY